jgi:hypothetical protein
MARKFYKNLNLPNHSVRVPTFKDHSRFRKSKSLLWIQFSITLQLTTLMVLAQVEKEPSTATAMQSNSSMNIRILLTQLSNRIRLQNKQKKTLSFIIKRVMFKIVLNLAKKV